MSTEAAKVTVKVIQKGVENEKDEWFYFRGESNNDVIESRKRCCDARAQNAKRMFALFW